MVKQEWVRFYRDLLAAGVHKGEAASQMGYEYELTTYQIRQVKAEYKRWELASKGEK